MVEPIDFLKKKAERDAIKKPSDSVATPMEKTGSDVANMDFDKLLDDMCFSLHKRYRVGVMKDGVPKDRKVAHELTMRLNRALEPLAKEFGATALFNLMGVRIFLSQNKTEYKKDPQNPHALYLNNDFTEEDIQRMLRPLLVVMTPEQRTANTLIHNLILGNEPNPFRKED